MKKGKVVEKLEIDQKPIGRRPTGHKQGKQYGKATPFEDERPDRINKSQQRVNFKKDLERDE